MADTFDPVNMGFNWPKRITANKIPIKIPLAMQEV